MNNSLVYLLWNYPCLVFDLDGTLCEIADPSHPNIHTWNEKVTKHVAKITDIHKDHWNLYRIIILTGRKEKEYWDLTRKWLKDNGIYYDHLLMQEWNTAEKNEVFKEKKLLEIAKFYDIDCVFDDNPKVTDICRKLGIHFAYVGDAKALSELSIEWISL
jgi:hypothetical protein